MQVYEELLVPRMFAPLAELLLDEVGVRAGDRALDVACGPGTVALAAARRGASVTGCDVSREMLDLARRKSTSVEWVETPAAPLAGIPDGAYDVATCQQGLQFFPDRIAAVAEMHRALVPGGRVAVSVWADIEQSPAFATLARAVACILGDEVAARFRGGPWGMPDPDELGAVLRQGGFPHVRVVQQELRATFDTVEQLASVLPLSPVADDVAALDDEARAALLAAVDERFRSSPLVSNLALAHR
jgi:SAM-dependent methyltransferase